MARKQKQHLKSMPSFNKGLKSMVAFGCGVASSYLYFEQNQPVAIIQAQGQTTLQACFTPHRKCQPLILKEIQQARSHIYVMAYYITAQSIVDHLIDAHRRGVQVHVIIDRSQVSRYTLCQQMHASGIPIAVDSSVAIAHNKVMVIDGQKVIAGSDNFTNAAEHKNAENLLVINSPELAKLYLDNWHERFQASKPYSQKQSVH